VRAKALIDTGAILAYINEDDEWYDECLAAIRQLPLPLATTSACLTEFFHLLGDHRRKIERAWQFILSDAIELAPITAADLPEIQRLMKQYADRPMDFADATLVHVANRESLTDICTVDHDDFETYRLRGRRKFRIVPARR
jgi:hypothetical protein